MSYSIKKNTITLTRGDTLKIQVVLTSATGSPYTPGEGDVIRFAVKKHVNDINYKILKTVDPETMILRLNPEDTANMDYGTYIYDMQLTKGDGEVVTFITKSNFILTEEVCRE